jgi:alpha-tubulin suppressor-like RCC1 family protein
MPLPHPALAVSAGSQHTIIRLSNGEVYTCGSGYNGRLGTGGVNDQLHPGLVQLPM